MSASRILPHTHEEYRGHAWVIDECGKYKLVFKNTRKNETFEIEDNFVHCNWGWNGLHNGFYLSDLLNTKKGPSFRVQDRYVADGNSLEEYLGQRKDDDSPDDVERDYNYKYFQKIISDIYPDIY